MVIFDFIKRQKGASAIEFAIILPVFILILFGSIEFSLLMFNKQVITNAAREGARAGIVVRGSGDPDIISSGCIRLTDAAVEAIVLNYAASHVITFGSEVLENSDITVIREGTDCAFGRELAVQIDYTYDFLVLSAFGFDPINVSSVAVMRLE